MKKQALVIGLDNFGASVVNHLTQDKWDVIAMDINEERVNKYKDIATKILQGDATDKETLEQIIGDVKLDVALVNIANDIKDSSTVLAITHLREFKEKGQLQQIYARAWDEMQGKVYKLVGADVIIDSEVIAAQQTVDELILPGRMKPANLSRYGLTVEFPILQDWVGKTLQELAIKEKYHIIILGTSQHTEEFNFNPHSSYKFREQDIVIAIGKKEDLEKLYKSKL